MAGVFDAIMLGAQAMRKKKEPEPVEATAQPAEQVTSFTPPPKKKKSLFTYGSGAGSKYLTGEETK